MMSCCNNRTCYALRSKTIRSHTWDSLVYKNVCGYKSSLHTRSTKSTTKKKKKQLEWFLHPLCNSPTSKVWLFSLFLLRLVRQLSPFLTKQDPHPVCAYIYYSLCVQTWLYQSRRCYFTFSASSGMQPPFTCVIWVLRLMLAVLP